MKNIKRVVILLVAMLLVGCGSKTHEETMLDIYNKDGYEKASEYIDSLEDPVEKLELALDLEAKNAGMTREEFENVLVEYDNAKNIHKKVDVLINEINDGKLKVTLKNNTGETLRYVKIDIFYYDKDDNLKDTEWANKSGTFLDGGEFVIETYVDIPEGATKYDVEVSEVSVK